MTRVSRRIVLSVLGCSAFGLAIAAAPGWQDGAAHSREIAPSGLIAVVYPTEGNKARGVVRFVERNGAVRVTARIEGLKPNSEHGFHVHEFGDASAPDGESAGDHFNPEGHEHGLPPDSRRHGGDFGNVKANERGVGELDLMVENLTLTGGSRAILGRAVIVHADPDDGGQPTGNAGDRIGIGVIGIARKGN
jgi:Cu-Zn family superoxide dismutase